MALSDTTLFERLRSADAPRDPSLSLDRPRLLRSIAHNLARILESRVGCAPAQPDFGMPDPAEVAHSLPDGADRMRRMLKAGIERYEPRLIDVQVLQVETEGDDYQLTLSIRAALCGMPAERVSLDATVDPSGKLRIRA